MKLLFGVFRVSGCRAAFNTEDLPKDPSQCKPQALQTSQRRGGTNVCQPSASPFTAVNWKESFDSHVFACFPTCMFPTSTVLEFHGLVRTDAANNTSSQMQDENVNFS